MKNKLSITFALLLAIFIPAGSALALGFGYNDPLQVQLVSPTGGDPNQGVINSINGVSSAINAQTQTLQNTQMEQQLAALDQECVTRRTAQIRATDGSVQTNKMIADYQNNTMAHMDLSNPANVEQARSDLDYLYSYIKAQNTQLNNALIHDCQKKIVSQVQTTAPPTPGLQCNGKSWNACPTGYNFFCPASGDPLCMPPQQPQVAANPPAAKTKTADTVSSPPTKQKAVAAVVPVTNVSSNATQPINPPAPAVAPKRGLWAWFKGLFGF